MKLPHRSTFAVLILALLATVAFSGCNTARGFGQDLKKAGQKIENAAK